MYVGKWKNGLKHGQGTYTYSNGGKYFGKFKDGKEHGQGIWIGDNDFFRWNKI